MEAVTAELPLYLQMSRYTKGSKAVMELRTERYLADQTVAAAKGDANDDALITGSITTPQDGKETAAQAAPTDEDGFSFDDFLDMVNPLQHLPVISTLYRELTGDELEPASRIVGGAIYGGPVGAGISVAEAVIEEATGQDVGGHIMSLLQGGSPAGTQTAAAATSVPADPAQSARTSSTLPNAEATTPMPTLSAEAFDALLTDPDQPAPAEKVHFALEQEQQGVAAAMALALDQYDMLKLVDEPAY
eukprot:s1_g650.t1